MNILVLGGTGAIGNPLVNILGNLGQEISVTSRKDRNSDSPYIHYIACNAMEDSVLKWLISKTKYDVIIDFMKYTEAQFKERAYFILDNCSQYIFISSSRVYADSDLIDESSDRILDVCDDSEYLRTDEYALSKARQENILFDSGQNNFTIIRPYISYHSNRFQLGVYEKESWLMRSLLGFDVIFPRSMAGKYTTLTYGLDVAKVICNVVGNEAFYGKVVNPVASTAYTWGEVFDTYSSIISELTGNHPSLVLVDDEIVIDRIPGQKYQIIYDRMFDRRFNNRTASELMEGEMFTSLHDGISMALSDFIDNGSFDYSSWKWEAWMDKYCNNKRTIKSISKLKDKLNFIARKLI